MPLKFSSARIVVDLGMTDEPPFFDDRFIVRACASCELVDRKLNRTTQYIKTNGIVIPPEDTKLRKEAAKEETEILILLLEAAGATNFTPRIVRRWIMAGA